MADLQRAEIKIREALRTETSAIRLSNTLFGPEGLFNQVARTPEERRAISLSPLFREAQERLSQLRQREAAEFSRAVDQATAALPDGEHRLRVQPVRQS